MLIKLIKHDMISLLKKMLSVWIILGIILGIQLLIGINDTKVNLSTGIEIPQYGFMAGIALSISTIIIFSFFISSYILAVQWFSTKMFKNEGYLTHTLPAKTSSIVLSKVITAILASTLSGILGFLSMQIIADVFKLSKPFELLTLFFSYALDAAPETFFKMSIFFILSGISFLMFSYLAIAISSIISWGNKSFNSFLLFVIFYIGSSFLFNQVMSMANYDTTAVSRIIDNIFYVGSSYNVVIIALCILMIIWICSKHLRLTD